MHYLPTTGLCLLATGIVWQFNITTPPHKNTTTTERDTPWQLHVIDDNSRGADGVKLADINQDGLLDIATGWEEGGVTRLYLHPGFDDVKHPWPAVTTGSTPSVEDAVFVDLDRDGAVDIVSCCEGRERKVIVQWSPRAPRRLLDESSWSTEPIPTSVDRMQWMYAWPMDVDENGRVDLVAAGKNDAAELGWFEMDESPRDLDAVQWHTISPVGWVMSIWLQDMDGDADIDLVLSDRRGELRGCRWLENPGSARRQTEPWENHFIGARDKEVMSMSLVDIDGDGLQDAIVATNDNEILILRRLDDSGTRWSRHPVTVPAEVGLTRAVMAAEIDGDGRLDLALTSWQANDKEGVGWLSYDDSPLNDTWRFQSISGSERGIKYDRLEMIDLDGDGDLDLLTCEESEGGRGLGVIWYENPTSRE